MAVEVASHYEDVVAPLCHGHVVGGVGQRCEPAHGGFGAVGGDVQAQYGAHAADVVVATDEYQAVARCRRTAVCRLFGQFAHTLPVQGVGADACCIDAAVIAFFARFGEVAASCHYYPRPYAPCVACRHAETVTLFGVGESAYKFYALRRAACGGGEEQCGYGEDEACDVCHSLWDWGS